MKEQQNIFGNLLFIAQQWTSKGDAILKEKAGITVKQWMLLVILQFHFEDQQPTLTETANAFGSSRQNIKQIVDSLARKGILQLKSDKSDSRAQRIYLTGKHHRFFEGEENLKWQQEYIESLFPGFSKEELILLNQFIERLKISL